MNKHSGMIRFVSASADGKFVISAGLFDKSVYVWDAKEGYLIGNIPDQVMVQNLQCSADGKFFLISGSAVSVFSLPECKKIGDKIFDAEELIFKTAIFTPDGTKILTVSGFGTLKYWDAQTGKYLSTLK
jgi:WD40 repeat protein